MTWAIEVWQVGGHGPPPPTCMHKNDMAGIQKRAASRAPEGAPSTLLKNNFVVKHSVPMDRNN